MTGKEAVSVLAATFLPNKELPRPTVEIYVSKLSDISGELLEAAIHRIVETWKFPTLPPIAEIRHAAASLAGVLPAGMGEAMAIVRAADVERPVYRRDGTYAYTEHEWQWPEALSWKTLGVIRAALAKAGESIDLDGKRVFGWEQGFKAAYEREVEEVVATLDLRTATKALPAGPKVATLPALPPPTGMAKTGLAIVQALVEKKITQDEAHRQLRELFGEQG